MNTAITYVGHATVLIEIQGYRILTDPLLQNQIFHLSRKGVSIPSSIYIRYTHDRSIWGWRIIQSMGI